jgi:hypothetical protein
MGRKAVAAMTPATIDERAQAVQIAVAKIGLPANFDLTALAVKLVTYADEADKAVDAAKLVEVTDQKSFDAATDVAASIRKVMAKIEPDRKSYTSALDATKKKLISLFAASADRMELSLDAIRRKMNAWRVEEEARLRKEAEEQRQREAEQAAALAKAAQAMGDNTGAAQIVAEAEERAAKPIEVKIQGSGAFGGKTVEVKRPVGEVTDALAFLRWAVEHAVMAAPALAGITFSKSALNTLAKDLLAGTERPTIPGFSYQYETNTQFR